LKPFSLLPDSFRYIGRNPINSSLFQLVSFDNVLEINGRNAYSFFGSNDDKLAEFHACSGLTPKSFHFSTKDAHDSS